MDKVRQARPSSAAAKSGRSDQLRRARAAAPPLRTAFPGIDQLRIELSFKDTGASAPADQAHVLYPPAPAFFTYCCPYSDCDGEFELEAPVNRAMHHRNDAEAGSLQCTGTRPSEPGAKRPCALRLAYAITAFPGKSF